MTDIVIAGAARTPIGAFNGAFATLPAAELGKVAIAAAMARAGIAGADVDEAVMGQVLTADAGMNPARQAAMAAGIPDDKTALTINQVCGSGLRAVAMAGQAIRAGDAAIVVAGGQENMSLSPHAAHLRSGRKMGDVAFTDTMIKDGLWDAFNGYHMGNTAENVAEKWQIARAEQDAFAAASQARAEAAQKAGRFAEEIAPVTVPHRMGDIAVEADEYPRHGTTAETLAKLRPAFAKDGTVTAGNASGINDGAAALVIMSAEEAARRGIEPLARIVSWATAGGRSGADGLGPDPGEPQGAGEGGVGHRRYRSGRIERGLRRPVLRGGPRSRLRHGPGERERRGDRARPPDRRLGRPGADHPALRDEAARPRRGSRHALHRRRHGHRHVCGAGLRPGQRDTA